MKQAFGMAMIAGAIVVVFVGISRSQQEIPRQPDQISVQVLARMEQMEQGQRQIVQKLDTVIANQQKILTELDVIRVRATRK